MIRCKCGKFTNFGLTCSNCRNSYMSKKQDEEYDFENIEKANDEEDEIPFDEVEEFFQRSEDDD
jgi:hypothetical protein